MIALDTSIVVAVFASWHEAHAEAEIVDRFLSESFPDTPLSLPGSAQRSLVGLAARARLPGGSICEALVAATAKHAGATLLTRDRRALTAYEAVGVD